MSLYMWVSISECLSLSLYIWVSIYKSLYVSLYLRISISESLSECSPHSIPHLQMVEVCTALANSLTDHLVYVCHVCTMHVCTHAWQPQLYAWPWMYGCMHCMGQPVLLGVSCLMNREYKKLHRSVYHFHSSHIVTVASSYLSTFFFGFWFLLITLTDIVSCVCWLLSSSHHPVSRVLYGCPDRDRRAVLTLQLLPHSNTCCREKMAVSLAN